MHYSYSPLRVTHDQCTKTPIFSLQNKNTNENTQFEGKSRFNLIWQWIQLERTSRAKYETV